MGVEDVEEADIASVEMNNVQTTDPSLENDVAFSNPFDIAQDSPSHSSPPPNKKIKKEGIPEWLAQPYVIFPEDEDSQMEEKDSPSKVKGTLCPGHIDTYRGVLSEKLIQNCKKMGYTTLFLVQKAVIPRLLQNPFGAWYSKGDLCVSAPTGSGKTLAYAIPIVETLSKGQLTRLQALIVLPTRDLALQVKNTFEGLVKGTRLNVACSIGQSSSLQEEQRLLVSEMKKKLIGGQSNIDILVTTPGRLMDHIGMTPNFSLQHLRYLVIDEADRLLNQSYQDWIPRVMTAIYHQMDESRPKYDSVVNKLPVHDTACFRTHPIQSLYDFDSISNLFEIPVQKLLFSATLTRNPEKIASLQLVRPQYLQVATGIEDESQRYYTPPSLKEYVTFCTAESKPALLMHLIKSKEITSALCFTNSVESTHRLHLLLSEFLKVHKDSLSNFKLAEYSSELQPQKRNSILKSFASGDIDMLICSDIISRGIDLNCVKYVINYNIPPHIKKYIHRVGRTARAGRDGTAFSLVEDKEAHHFRLMMRKCDHWTSIQQLRIKPQQYDEMQKKLAETLSSLRN